MIGGHALPPVLVVALVVALFVVVGLLRGLVDLHGLPPAVRIVSGFGMRARQRAGAGMVAGLVALFAALVVAVMVSGPVALFVFLFAAVGPPAPVQEPGGAWADVWPDWLPVSFPRPSWASFAAS